MAKAHAFTGTPYVWAGSKPKSGFDCSGYIYYLLNSYGVKSPRTSKDFTNFGQTLSLKDARVGDIILFTGSDNSSGIVGHMGIITSTSGTLQFIHASSGRSRQVITTKLEGYWREHFVKVIRIFQ